MRAKLLALFVLFPAVTGAVSYWVSAQDAAPRAPHELLPANAQVFAAHEGVDAHAEGLKQTAAYKALYDSDLMPRLFKLFDLLLQRNAPEHAREIRTAIDHITRHGFSAAAHVEGEGQDGRVLAIVVLHEAGQFYDHLRGTLGPDVEEQDVGDRTVAMRTLRGGPAEFEIGFWQEGSHLVFAAGQNAVAQATAIASGEAPNIAEHPRWAEWQQRPEGFASIQYVHTDVANVLESLSAVTIPVQGSEGGVKFGDVFDIWHSNDVQTVSSHTGYEGEAIWTRGVVQLADEPQGIGKLLTPTPMTLTDLPPLPADAQALFAFRCDPALIYDMVLENVHATVRIAQPAAEADLDRALEEARRILGVDLRDDLIAGLDQTFAGYSAGGGAIPGLGVEIAIGVKDADQVRRTLSRLAANAAERSNGKLTVSRLRRDNFEIISLNFAEIPFAPSFVVTDKWLCIALTSQGAETFVLRQTGRIDSWKPDAELQAILDGFPKEFTSLQVSDPRPMITMALSMAPFLTSTLRTQPGMRDFPFEALQVPPPALVTEPLFPGVSMTFTENGDVVTLSRQSLPAVPPFSFASGGGAATSGVLVALLLPAVQQAREAARRTQSMNNAKQIMLALHNYHDVQGMFPAGTHGPAVLKPEERLSWLADILPYLEQANLYNQLNFSAGWEAERNQQFVQTALQVYRNPSEAAGEPHFTHYAGVGGLGEKGPTLPVTDPSAGMFGWLRTTRLSDVTDGLSNTLAVGEVNQNLGPWAQGGLSTVRPFVEQPYIHGPDGWGGSHAGGAIFGFGDGSVRFISEDTAPEVIEALTTIRGGEVTPQF